MFYHNIPTIGLSYREMQLITNAASMSLPIILPDIKVNYLLHKGAERNELGLNEKEMEKLRRTITTPLNTPINF